MWVFFLLYAISFVCYIVGSCEHAFSSGYHTSGEFQFQTHDGELFDAYCYFDTDTNDTTSFVKPPATSSVQDLTDKLDHLEARLFKSEYSQVTIDLLSADYFSDKIAHLLTASCGGQDGISCNDLYLPDYNESMILLTLYSNDTSKFNVTEELLNLGITDLQSYTGTLPSPPCRPQYNPLISNSCPVNVDAYIVIFPHSLEPSAGDDKPCIDEPDLSAFTTNGVSYVIPEYFFSSWRMWTGGVNCTATNSSKMAFGEIRGWYIYYRAYRVKILAYPPAHRSVYQETRKRPYLGRNML